MCAKLKQMSLDIGTRDRDNHLDILHCMDTRLLFDFDFVRKKMKLNCDIYFFQQSYTRGYKQQNMTGLTEYHIQQYTPHIHFQLVKHKSQSLGRL